MDSPHIFGNYRPCFGGYLKLCKVHFGTYSPRSSTKLNWAGCAPANTHNSHHWCTQIDQNCLNASLCCESDQFQLPGLISANNTPLMSLNRIRSCCLTMYTTNCGKVYTQMQTFPSSVFGLITFIREDANVHTENNRKPRS